MMLGRVDLITRIGNVDRGYIGSMRTDGSQYLHIVNFHFPAGLIGGVKRLLAQQEEGD